MSALGSLYIMRGSPEGDLSGCCETADWAAQEIERLDAELAALRAVQAEPVAWRAIGGSIWGHKSSWEDIPLYAAPQQSSQPLTDEQIIDLWADVSIGDDEISIIDMARAIERAHGIGEKT